MEKPTDNTLFLTAEARRLFDVTHWALRVSNPRPPGCKPGRLDENAVSERTSDTQVSQKQPPTATVRCTQRCTAARGMGNAITRPVAFGTSRNNHKQSRSSCCLHRTSAPPHASRRGRLMSVSHSFHQAPGPSRPPDRLRSTMLSLLHFHLQRTTIMHTPSIDSTQQPLAFQSEATETSSTTSTVCGSLRRPRPRGACRTCCGRYGPRSATSLGSRAVGTSLSRPFAERAPIFHSHT